METSLDTKSLHDPYTLGIVVLWYAKVMRDFEYQQCHILLSFKQP